MSGNEWQGAFCGRDLELSMLTELWKKVKAEQAGAKMICLVGESGIGKTRIVQEFYSRLRESDDIESYWPSSLSPVNPDFKGHAQGKGTLMPFLWWGLSFGSYGRTIDAHLRYLTDHLEPMYQTRVRRTLGKNSSWAIVETAATIAANYFTAGAASLVCDAISNAGNLQGAVDSLKSARATNSNQNVIELIDHNDEDVDEKILSDFRCIFDAPDVTMVGKLKDLIKKDSALDMKTLPMVLYLDQIELIDSSSVTFLDKFISEAFEKKWPILFITTCKIKEWNDCMQSDNSLNDLLCSIRKSKEASEEVSFFEVQPLQGKDSGLFLKAKFTGLSDEHINLLVNKAGGHALLLCEIVDSLDRHKKWFIDGSTANGLSDIGVMKIKESKFTLHRLIRERIESEGEECCDVIGLASYQGYQFAHNLTVELAKRINNALSQDNAEVSLNKSINPLSIVRSVELSVSEFSHTAYYEVAKDYLGELEEVHGDLSPILSNVLIDWMVFSDKFVDDDLEAELLARLTLEHVKLSDSAKEDVVIVRLARTRARAILLGGKGVRGYKVQDKENYQEELTGLLSLYPFKSSLIQKCVYSIDCSLSALCLITGIDGFPQHKHAYKLYCEVIGERIKGLEFEQSSVKIDEFIGSLYCFILLATKVSVLKEADIFIDEIKQLDQKLPQHLLRGLEILLLIAKLKSNNTPDVEHGEKGELKRSLVNSAINIFDKPVPHKLLITIIQFVSLSDISSIKHYFGGDTLWYDVNDKALLYLDSIRGADAWDNKCRGLYPSLLNNLIPYNSELRENIRIHERIISFYCDELDMVGSSAIYDEASNRRLNWQFSSAVKEIIDFYMSNSTEYDFAIRKVRVLLRDSLTKLENRSEYKGSFDILELIVDLVSRNLVEVYSFSDEFMRNIIKTSITCLGLDKHFFNSEDFNATLFGERCLLNFLPSFNKYACFMEGKRNDIIRSCSLIFDMLATGDVNKKISKIDWGRLHRSFKFLPKLNMYYGKDMIEEILGLLTSKITELEDMLESNDTIPNNLQALKLLKQAMLSS